MSDYKAIMERLKLYYGVKKNTELADKLGANYDTVKSWISRKKIVTDKLLLLMKDEPINITWLLTGEGPMRVDDAFGAYTLSQLKDFKDNAQEIADLIKLLKYAPKSFIQQITKRLEEFKKLSEI